MSQEIDSPPSPWKRAKRKTKTIIEKQVLNMETRLRIVEKRQRVERERNLRTSAPVETPPPALYPALTNGQLELESYTPQPIIRDRDKVIDDKFSKEWLIAFGCLSALATLIIVGFALVIGVILWRSGNIPFLSSHFYHPTFPIQSYLHAQGLSRIDSGITFSSNENYDKSDSKKIIPIRLIGKDQESAPGLGGISEWTLRKMNEIGHEKKLLKENQFFQFSEKSSLAIVFKVVFTRIEENLNPDDFDQAHVEGKKVL